METVRFLVAYLWLASVKYLITRNLVCYENTMEKIFYLAIYLFIYHPPLIINLQHNKNDCAIFVSLSALELPINAEV